LGRWQPFGDVPKRVLVSPDAHVLLFGLVLSFASGLLCGQIPARQIWRTDAAQMMKSGSTAVAIFRRFHATANCASSGDELPGVA
jgi:hypothetical protein